MDVKHLWRINHRKKCGDYTPYSPHEQVSRHNDEEMRCEPA